MRHACFCPRIGQTLDFCSIFAIPLPRAKQQDFQVPPPTSQHMLRRLPSDSILWSGRMRKGTFLWCFCECRTKLLNGLLAHLPASWSNAKQCTPLLQEEGYISDVPRRGAWNGLLERIWAFLQLLDLQEESNLVCHESMICHSNAR